MTVNTPTSSKTESKVNLKSCWKSLVFMCVSTLF